MSTESKRHWPWLPGGVALGLVFLLAVVLVKPIGVSTQYVILDGIAWHQVDSDLIQANAAQKHHYESPNAYLNKGGGKYAHAIAEPLNYSFVFVLAVALGGLLSHLWARRKAKDSEPDEPPLKTTGEARGWVRPLLGGFLVLFGARLAGGCTSGHMMSGMMQTALSGYLFAAAVFVSGIPVAIWLPKRQAGGDA